MLQQRQVYEPRLAEALPLLQRQPQLPASNAAVETRIRTLLEPFLATRKHLFRNAARTNHLFDLAVRRDQGGHRSQELPDTTLDGVRGQPQDSTDGLLDVSDYEVKTILCPECQQHYARVTGYVARGQETLAAYYAVCHGHPDHEVALDMMFGTWGSGDMSDHETFSCRVRPDGAMVVDPFVTLSLDPGADDLPAIFGRTVPREEALHHPMLRQVWQVVDALVVGVEPVAEQYNAR